MSVFTPIAFSSQFKITQFRGKDEREDETIWRKIRNLDFGREILEKNLEH